MQTEAPIFNDADAHQIADNPQAGDEGLSVWFHKESRQSTIKSKGGLLKFDKWADVRNVELLKADLTACGIKFTERENEKDDTIEIRVMGAGRPIFEDVEFVTIQIPGDKCQINDFEVNDAHRARFAKQYRKWKAGESNTQSGTPLKEWPAIARSQADELAHFGIHTVEQLAAMPDGNASNVGPIQSLKRQAKDFLEAAKGLAPVAQLRAELESRDMEIAALKAQMQQVLAAQAKQAQPEEPAKRGPGRPKKEEANG